MNDATRSRLDADLTALRGNALRWARLPIPEKVLYLRAALRGTGRVARRQVEAAHRAKRIDPSTSAAAEDWLGGPVIQARVLRQLAQSLEDVARSGAPEIPRSALDTRRDGRLVVDAFPRDRLDRLLFPGFRCEVWMDRAVDAENLTEHQAGFYAVPDPSPRVALVLGAGNVASIGPLDAVQKLFVEGQVTLLKLNPVNDYLAPFIEEAFADLVRDGFLRTARGGADVGAYLCDHADVDEIHITGSDRTHDAIVFGSAAAKKRKRPKHDKRITSELGNVSPVVVLPGPWTRADLRFQAENVATQMTNNGGFNCNAAKVLVLPRAWPQRRAFLDMVRAVLAATPQRHAYYPGAEARYDHFLSAHPEAEAIGARRDGVLPWTIIPHVDPSERDDPCFTTESFCAITAVTTLPGDDAASFLRNAVGFCNDTLWGTLSCCLVVHPTTERRLGPALHGAIDALRYGTVATNHWAALGYALGTPPWGAAPGHTLDDIQSGVGWVHNSLLFDRPHKSVVRGPFRVRPRPPWFVTHRTVHQMGPALLRLELEPGLARVPGVVWPALRG